MQKIMLPTNGLRCTKAPELQRLAGQGLVEFCQLRTAILQPVNFKLAQFLTFQKFVNTLYLCRNLAWH